MATVEKVLNAARKELGVKENPPNSNKQKFGARFKNNGQPWCAWFVCYVFDITSSLKLLLGNANGYTVTLAKRFYNAKQWGTKPRVGAIAFFHFGNPNYGNRWKGIHHTGIVESVQPDGRVITIEGNTGSGNNADGGQVQRRIRSLDNIAGFGYPKYDIPKKKEPKKTQCHSSKSPILRLDNKGAWVKHLQADLNRVAKTRLVVDGVFGPKTLQAVKNFQKKSKLIQDGVVGPLTWNKLL